MKFSTLKIVKNCPPPVYLLILATFFAFSSCNETDNTPLQTYPVVLKAGDAPRVYEIPDFSLANQLGETVTNANFDQKIYVANFFSRPALQFAQK